MTESKHVMSRRSFMGGVAGAAVAAGVLGGLPDGLTQALAEPRRRGRLDQVEHVIILMQENRSFDHYYGTMRGVRGFADKTALCFPGGADVLHQPDPSRSDGGYLLPYHVDTRVVDGQDLGDLAHDWATTHVAVDLGKWDAWIAAKTEATMGYFTAADLPFHRALASAFTICDQYFCSIQAPTTPNRLFHWTGTIDPQGKAGGPATFNPDDYNPVYRWKTYPERLQAAGISWQVYANDEVGDGSDGYVGDYGDNPLWLFQAYHDALASSDPAVHQLAERASLRNAWLPDSGLGHDVDHVLAQFISDCQAGTLPQVSWIVGPYAYCEHPAARPVDGAAYIQAVLTALWDNPKLWESTVLFINFDENDGFYDHVVSPMPPPGTPDEFLPLDQVETPGQLGMGPLVPIGLGPRVPMTVISPWSRGGWVNSQVSDHTSVLRFLEQWTGVFEPNISAWRRAICGDLTSCFDFGTHNPSVPTLPNTSALRAKADLIEHTLPTPAPPVPGAQVVPSQEAGTAPARPLPYQPVANVSVTSQVILDLANHGSAAMQMAIYANHLANSTPQMIDVASHATAQAQVALATSTGAYDVSLHSANGFVRRATGDATTSDLGVEVAVSIVGPLRHPYLMAEIRNEGDQPVTILSSWTGGHRRLRLGPGQHEAIHIDAIQLNHGWYDISVALDGHPTFVRWFAGHLENGMPSRTG